MQPLLNYVRNFDANKDYTFGFTYLGSERIITNELQIRESASQTWFYSRQSTKFDKNHVLPAGTLKNGVSYTARIRVKLDTTNNWSDFSPELSFITLKTPRLTFNNLQDDKYVFNNDVLMQVLFQQEQGDRVESYQFILMDQNKSPINKYPPRVPEISNPNLLTERISGLTKGKLYYIGCQVRTVNGVDFLDTHEFIAHFVAPSMGGEIQVYNDEDKGQVLVQAFLRQHLGIQTQPFVEGSSNDLPINYVFLDNEKVVIPPDKPLAYRRLGMAKSSDWIMKVWCENVLNGEMFTFKTEHNSGIGVTFVKHDNYVTAEKEYLNEDGTGVKSRHRSNVVTGLKLKKFYMYIKVIEYRIDIEIVPVN